MEVYGEESRQKVERHRRMRAGKGFATIERPKDLSLACAWDAMEGIGSSD